MRQKLLPIICLLFLLTIPIGAQTETYKIYLNDVPYQTALEPVEANDTLYLSLSDFSTMIWAPVTYENYTYHFNVNNQSVKLYSNANTYTLDGESQQLPAPLLIVDGQVYIPVELFDELGFHYTHDTKQKNLALEVGAPYSRNVDSPENHSFAEVKVNLTTPPAHLALFSDEETLEETIVDAIQNDYYVSFLSHSAIREVYKANNHRFELSPYNNISLTYRHLDTSVYPHVITDTVTIPVSLTMDWDEFTLTIGDETFISSQLWSAFYPSQSLTQMDLTKSVDTTLMKFLYSYYRDTHDLRDDLYFSPLMLLSSERTNTFSQKVYSKTLEGDITTYMLNMYRVHPSGSLEFVIDLEQID